MKENVFQNDEALKRELLRCMKCGNCMAVCPVYSSETKESAVARGKIALGEAYLSGSISGEELKNLLYNCLVCKSCMMACPSGVKFDRIILALRHRLALEKGLPPVKKAAFWSLSHPAILAKGAKVSAKLQNLFLRQKDRGLRSPRSFLKSISRRFDEDFVVPELPLKSFRETVPEVINSPDYQATALFFTGCSINYIYPEIGNDIILVLKKNRVKILIPEDQSCCGMPVMVHGDIECARELARNNIDLFERLNPQFVVTGCASCASALKSEYPVIFEGDAEYEGKAAKWADRTYDITSFLLKAVKFRKPEGRLDLSVTYHDPCHLKKSVKVWAEPREIIRSIPGIKFVEMRAPDACCGSGGSYHLSHPENSLKILKSKIEDVKNTKADVVVTECPACLMQLTDGVLRYNAGTGVRHVISLLADAYRSED